MFHFVEILTKSHVIKHKHHIQSWNEEYRDYREAESSHLPSLSNI